jgi:glyoxylase-like metal-dependent hydrolase (beta-lactamase superfamily II)/rhodanese-related sulfurtransferase
MIFRQLFDQETWTYTYLLADEQSGAAILIDPVLEQVERDAKLIEELGLRLDYILETHVHADHITGAGRLRERLGAKTVFGEAAGVGCSDILISDGDTLDFGALQVEARSTPGHTAGCMTYVVRDNERTMAFTGDALLIRGSGRTDFQGGSAATLYESVHNKIFSLPTGTEVFPGHDYRGHRSTTVAEELAYNPRLGRAVSKAQFINIMAELNLANPKKLHLAVPANSACGRTAEERGEPEPVRQLQPKDADALAGYRIIDVRDLHEWDDELGHLDQAELVPLGTLATEASDWDRTESLLVLCRSGKRSTEAYRLLAGAGFTNLTNMDGGMMAWNDLHAATNNTGARC